MMVPVITLTSDQIKDMKVLKLPDPSSSYNDSSDTTTASSSSATTDSDRQKRSAKQTTTSVKRVSSKDKNVGRVAPDEVPSQPPKPSFPLHSIPSKA